MAILPTRTSADSNSSADINELSTEALDKGGTSQLSALTEEASPGSGDWFLMEDGGTGALKKVDSDNLPGSGGGSTQPDPVFPAGSFDYPTSNPAPLEVINSGSITNVRLLGQAFDDTTNETVTREFKVPSDIDTAGTVTFSVIGIAQTAASANVEYRFAHSVSNSAEQSDVAYTNEDSGAKAVDTNQDYNTYFTWTETVSNLGWAASDMCKFQLTRLAAGGNDTLSDDFYVRHFEITIPRA